MYFLYKNEYRIFKPIEITIRRGLRYKGEKKEVIIHIYMEMSQWNSLYSYLKQTKMSFFRNSEQEGKSGPALVVGPSGKGEDIRKVCGWVNMMEILRTHVWKWKNEVCWNCSRNGGGKIKENDGGSEYNYDIL
jgi:hypothetical protein